MEEATNIKITTIAQHAAVMELDRGFVGTENYMGVASFWDQRIKHVMREMSCSTRVKVHAAFLERGVPFDVAGRYFHTTDAALQIVEERQWEPNWMMHCSSRRTSRDASA